MGDESDVRVDEDPERSAFVLRVDGVEAGRADVRRRPGREEPGTIVLVHTEVDEAYAGRGLASRVVRAVFDAARDEEVPVVPRCAYAQKWLGSHTEYLADVPARVRTELGLGEPQAEGAP
jgi:predicted GNAT family acetyltransferase